MQAMKHNVMTKRLALQIRKGLLLFFLGKSMKLIPYTGAMTIKGNDRFNALSTVCLQPASAAN